jgi:hypothetical protein
MPVVMVALSAEASCLGARGAAWLASAGVLVSVRGRRRAGEQSGSEEPRRRAQPPGAAVCGRSSWSLCRRADGHRWRVLDQLAAGRGLALVCVQPLLVYRTREGEDLTRESLT